MDETLQIDTPENVIFGYAVAGIGSRFLAALVDTLIIGVIQALVYGLLFSIIISSQNDQLESWLIALFGLLAFVLLWGYYVFFELLWNGQSPGKRWVGLRVIRTDGTPIALTESLVRNLVRLIDFMPMAYGFGVVTMFLNSQARRLGDLAAGTLVVHDQVKLSLQDVRPVQMSYKAQLAAPATDLPVERLSQRDILLLEEYFQRSGNMVQKQGLAARILSSLYAHMDITDRPAIPEEAETALAGILNAVRGQQGSKPEGPSLPNERSTS